MNRFQNVRGVSPLLCTLYFLPDVIFGIITVLVMARIIPMFRVQFLFIAGLLFMLCAPLLMNFSPAQQSYWPQSFPAVSLSSIGGMTLFNVSNVFVSSAVARDDQGLGQGIFNTMVQIGTAISLAIAATVAHAGGVSADASIEQLLHGYRDCFWLAVGLLVPPIVGCLFLKKGRATESSGGNPRTEKTDEKVDGKMDSKLDEKTEGQNDTKKMETV
jgi:MFS family permease